MVLHYNLESKSLITEKETPLENLQCELALEQTERKEYTNKLNFYMYRFSQISQNYRG